MVSLNKLDLTNTVFHLWLAHITSLVFVNKAGANLTLIMVDNLKVV